MIPHARVTSLCRFCCLLFVFLFLDEDDENKEEEEERVSPLRCFLNPAGAAAAEAADIIFPFTVCVYSNAPPRIHKESKRVRENQTRALFLLRVTQCCCDMVDKQRRRRACGALCGERKK
jgi:hypothetical protein